MIWWRRRKIGAATVIASSLCSLAKGRKGLGKPRGFQYTSTDRWSNLSFFGICFLVIFCNMFMFIWFMCDTCKWVVHSISLHCQSAARSASNTWFSLGPVTGKETVSIPYRPTYLLAIPGSARHAPGRKCRKRDMAYRNSRWVGKKWTETKWKAWNEWIDMHQVTWMTWNEGIETQELKRMNCLNWDERIEMKELKWIKKVNWHEWIETNESKGMNWNERIQTKEMTWRNWNEGIDMMELKWRN